MTPEQYERWQDFALRMARTCWDERNRPGRAWIVKQVEHFFCCFDENLISVTKGWDEYDEFPPEHPYYRRRELRSCFFCHGWKREGCTNSRCEDGRIYEYDSPIYVATVMSEWEVDTIYCYAWNFGTERERKKLERICDDYDKYDELREKITEKWSGPVHCCIRAGLDMASEPSCGVLGFTMGDLRRMYDGTLPEWIASSFVDDAATIEDTEGIWL